MTAINNMTLYIPHVFANIDKERILNAFECQNIGKVKNIDLVGKMGKDGKNYNAVYIHFEYWYDNSIAHNFQERVLNPNKEARIVYEHPWFWIVLENKTQKHIPGSRKAKIATVPNKVNQVTPIAKQMTNKDFSEFCRAPIKSISYKDLLKDSAEIEFDVEFNELCREIHFDKEEEDEANMDQIEKLMDEEDQHLTTFDKRYVQLLEYENAYYRNYLTVYYENLGRSQHQLSIFMDENISLKSELSLLKEQGIVNPEVYY